MLAAALTIAACTDDEADEGGFEFEASDVGDDDDAPALGNEFVPDDEIPGLLAELEEAGFCDPADIENEGLVSAMHFVVGGDVQPACYTEAGGDDQRLLDAWGELTSVAPRSLYDDVSLLAGFESCDDCDTLAFVTTLDEASSFFMMAIAVDQGEADPDELRLTMLHELTHVFGQDPRTQLDVTVIDADDCDTYFNGNGCFRDGSYLDEWIDAFWPPELLDELPGDGESLDDDTAFEICSFEGGFTGSYAATSPEEDFAETFSAFVFDVDAPEDLADKYDFLAEYPEFVEMRDNARAAGLAGLTSSSFDFCL